MSVPVESLVRRALAGQPVVREVHATFRGLSPPAYARVMADLDEYLYQLASSGDLVADVLAPAVIAAR